MLRLASGLSILLLFAAAPAEAEDVAAAREHYRRGTTLFDLRRYDDAAKEYEAAFEAKDEPTLLFNIGQAYRLGGRAREAEASYRAYLRRVPDAPNRADVETFIEGLRQQMEKEKAVKDLPPAGPLPQPGGALAQPPPAALPAAAIAPAPPPEAPAPPTTGRANRHAGIALLGAGGGLLALGVVFGALAQVTSDQYTKPAPGTRFDPAVDARGVAYMGTEIAALAVGGAAAAAGVALFVIGRRAERRPAQALLLPALSPGFAGAALTVIH